MASFQDSIMNVLSTNKLYISHPASIELGSDLYATPQTAVVESARRHRYTGRVKVSSNSLSLQGVSTFSLDAGVIYNKLYIYGRFNDLPADCIGCSGWGYNLIKSVEFKCSGSSSIQNLKIDGESLLDMILVSTNSSDKRNQLIELGGNQFWNSDGTSDQDFFIPLYMLFTSADSGNVFPFDSSTIRSPISFSIEWNPLYKVMSGSITAGATVVNNPVTLPTSFSELFLRAHNSIELEDQFVAKKMAMYPQLTYSVPCNYIQSYRVTVNFANLTDEIQIPLTSFPVGMLQCIVMSVKPQDWQGTSSTLTWTNNTVSVPLEYVRVLYNGQTMFETNSALEHEGVGCVMDDGSSNLYSVTNLSSIEEGDTAVNFSSYLTIIPFVNEISQVLRGKYHENVQSYASSTLQVFLKLSQKGLKQVIAGSSSAPSYLELPTGNYDIVFTYVTAALLEVNRGTMSLQLE